MSAPSRVFPDPDALGEVLATTILDAAAEAAAAGRPFLLGCPTGRSPGPVYAAVARRLRGEPQSLRHVRIVLMDEYLTGAPDALAPAPAEAHFSCRGFAGREIAAAWNAALADAHRLAPDAVWCPDPRAPEAYDARIAAAGGIDLFILASGASDGHVAFNPPGTPPDTRTRVVPLAESTRRDNLATFPAFRGLDDVPRFGVTVGIATIAAARSAVMVLWGEGKRRAFGRIVAATAYEPGWPATIVHACARGTILADAAAAL